MRSVLTPCLFCLATLLAGTAAEASVKITVEETMGSAEPRSNVILMQPDRMAMATPRGRMIFRDDLQTAWIVNDGQKRYYEMNAESMQQAKAAMQAAMEKMQTQLKSLPPDKRKQVEAMMEAQGMPTGQNAEVPAITYRRLGQNRKVGNWPCEMFEQDIGGRKQAEFCAARLDAVGLTRDDLTAFRHFFQFTEKAMPETNRRRASMVDFDALSKAAGYDAIPLEVAVYDNNQRVSHSVVRGVDRIDIPASTFELPAGYAKEDVMRPGAGGGGQQQ